MNNQCDCRASRFFWGRTPLLLLSLLSLGFAACIKSSVNGTLPYYYISADTNNNRVLLWHNYPSTFDQPADLVLGQPTPYTKISENGGVSSSSMSFPNGICLDANHLFVIDTNNNRIFIWNEIPTTNFQAADVIVGQPAPTVRTCNNGGPAVSLCVPTGCFSDGQRLFVADGGNNRVLIWNKIPTTNRSADLVLGQPTLSAVTANNPALPAGAQLNSPQLPFFDGTHLIVADETNNRVLIWNSLPVANGQSADLVLGQSSFNATSANQGASSPTGFTLNGPVDVFSVGSKLLVSDAGNNRVLVWNSFPTVTQQPADVVVGEPDMFTVNTTPSAVGGSFCSGAFLDGRRLIVSQPYANRTLIWNSLPQVNGQPADFVLGQPDFVSHLANQGGAQPTAATLAGVGRQWSNVDIFGVWRPDGY